MNLYSIPPLLTLVCFVGLAVLTVLRGSKTRVNILFFVICILGSFLYIDILFVFHVKSASTALWISRIDHFFIVYLFPVYLHFFHAYLNLSGRKRLVVFSYVYAGILMCFTPTPLYIASMQRHYFGFFAKGGMLYPLFGLGVLFVTVYVLIIIHRAIRSEQSGIRKNRLKYLFAGFGIMGLMNGLNIFPVLGYSVYPPGNLSFIPLIFFAVGLFKHDLFDMGILIKKSLSYSVLTVLLTFMYALIIIIAGTVVKDFKFSDSIFFQVLFFLLIAFVFGPLKTKIQTVIDRIFYKGKYDYQKTVKNVGRMITSVLDLNKIAGQLLDTVVDVMQVDHCALFLNHSNGTGFLNFATRGRYDTSIRSKSMADGTFLVKFMRKHRRPVIKQDLMKRTADSETEGVISDMDALHAEMVLPMVFKETLNGFIVLGEKLSGDLFFPEDIDLLETLSSQSSVAIENARSYKKVEDLNKNLENKVEKRTLALKEALTEKERTQEQLVRSESLAAIGQLVAGTAHELNNPLTSVTSLVQSTIEDLEQWNSKTSQVEEWIDDLKFADKELERARLIVASLLGLSRQTQTYSEAVNINSVVKDALRVLYNQYKYKDLDVVENYAVDLPHITGNFANLGQVVINIIQNAIQAVIDKKGTVFLTTYFDNDTAQVVFECRDTGPGIPKSIRQDIFKPFFTTKEVGKGTGLGLYICHEIVQKHNGTLMLENGNGQGAQFVVRLPADN